MSREVGDDAAENALRRLTAAVPLLDDVSRSMSPVLFHLASFTDNTIPLFSVSIAIKVIRYLQLSDKAKLMLICTSLIETLSHIRTVYSINTSLRSEQLRALSQQR